MTAITSEAFKEAASEGDIATRTDMLRLEHKFDLIANELKLHRWILAIIAAGVLLPAIRQLF